MLVILSVSEGSRRPSREILCLERNAINLEYVIFFEVLHVLIL